MIKYFCNGCSAEIKPHYVLRVVLVDAKENKTTKHLCPGCNSKMSKYLESLGEGGTTTEISAELTPEVKDTSKLYKVSAGGRVTFTEEGKQKIVAMYAKGLSVPQIADELNLKYNQIYQLVKKHEADAIPNLNKDTSADTCSDEDWAAIKAVVDVSKVMALHKAGWSVDAIAGDLGVSSYYIEVVLARKQV